MIVVLLKIIENCWVSINEAICGLHGDVVKLQYVFKFVKSGFCKEVLKDNERGYGFCKEMLKDSECVYEMSNYFRGKNCRII